MNGEIGDNGGPFVAYVAQTGAQFLQADSIILPGPSDNILVTGIEDINGLSFEGLPLLLNVQDGNQVLVNQLYTSQDDIEISEVDSKNSISFPLNESNKEVLLDGSVFLPAEPLSDQSFTQTSNVVPTEKVLPSLIFDADIISRRLPSTNSNNSSSSSSNNNSTSTSSSSSIVINPKSLLKSNKRRRKTKIVAQRPILEPETAVVLKSIDELEVTALDEMKPNTAVKYIDICGTVYSIDTARGKAPEVLALKAEEPDSTMLGDADDLQEMANVVTAYNCKRCSFICYERGRFLRHFKESHGERNSFITPKQDVKDIQEIESSDAINYANVGVDECNLEATLATDPKDILNPMKRKFGKTKGNLISKILADSTNSAANLNMLSSVLSINIYNDSEETTSTSTANGTAATVSAASAVATADSHEEVQIIHSDDAGAEDQTSSAEIVANAESGGQEGAPGYDQMIYVCSNCSSEFGSVEECKRHMIDVHKMSIIGNKIGKYPTKTPTASQSPAASTAAAADDIPSGQTSTTKAPSSQTVFALDPDTVTRNMIKSRRCRCSLKGCHLRFNKAEQKALHESCHVEGSKSFKCCLCEAKHSTWNACTNHLWNVHSVDVDLYSCPVCLEFKSAAALNLRNHLKVHSDTRSYVCQDCNRSFKQPSQLYNHRVKHIDKQSMPVSRWYTEKKCEICEKVFSDSKSLKKHVQAIHSRLRPFICSVCGHSCARKSMLQMHLRQHTGEKPYACKTCNFRTGDHNSLRRHVMRHSGVRPYKCPHCNYTAIQSNSYKNHLASKHPGKEGAFACTQCSFKTVNEDSFLGHMKDHKTGLIEQKKIESLLGNRRSNLQVVYKCVDTNNRVTEFTRAIENGDGTEEHSGAVAIAISDANKGIEADDDETQSCFLADLHDESSTVDTGGITIPAEPTETSPNHTTM